MKEAKALGLEQTIKGHFYTADRKQFSLNLDKTQGIEIDTGYGGMSM